MGTWNALIVIVLLAVAGQVCRGEKVCIVGSGIGGASAAYVLESLSSSPLEIHIYEQHDRVGGRLAVVQLGVDWFESGGSIIHQKNALMISYADLLHLKRVTSEDDDNFGIWNGNEIVFSTSKPGVSFISRKMTKIWNSLALFWRYGMNLFKMQSLVNKFLQRFMKLYSVDLPVFDTVEDLLRSIGLFNTTQKTLRQELESYGIDSRLTDELITVIMRINYNQNVNISGLAGSVSLAGSGGDLWHVEGGNWRIPEGLIKITNASLHLNEKVLSVTSVDGVYDVGLSSGKIAKCGSVIIATPLDEESIEFKPPVEYPKRSLQHTHATFVRGLVNPEYFGLKSAGDVPALIGTMEDPLIPFSSISVLKEYSDLDNAYKVFSRAPLSENVLDQIFRIRNSTIPVDWAAYPHYTPPEQFAPFILDGHRLYYINGFESAASAMECSAVAAKNVARLVLSKLNTMREVL